MRLRLHRDCDRILIQQSFNLLTLINRHSIRAFIRLPIFYATWTAFLSCWYTNRSPSSQLAILTVAARWPAILLSGITGGQLPICVGSLRLLYRALKPAFVYSFAAPFTNKGKILSAFSLWPVKGVPVGQSDYSLPSVGPLMYFKRNLVFSQRHSVVVVPVRFLESGLQSLVFILSPSVRNQRSTFSPAPLIGMAHTNDPIFTLMGLLGVTTPTDSQLAVLKGLPGIMRQTKGSATPLSLAQLESGDPRRRNPSELESQSRQLPPF